MGIQLRQLVLGYLTSWSPEKVRSRMDLGAGEVRSSTASAGSYGLGAQECRNPEKSESAVGGGAVLPACMTVQRTTASCCLPL